MVKAKFKIGSIHGRVNYNREERVFHGSDMPDIAKARREVHNSLSELRRAVKGLVLHPPWNPDCRSGVANNCRIRAPWDTLANMKPSVVDGEPVRFAGIRPTSSAHRQLAALQQIPIGHASRGPLTIALPADGPQWQASTLIGKSTWRSWPASTLDRVPAPIGRQSLLAQARNAMKSCQKPTTPVIVESSMENFHEYLEGSPTMGDNDPVLLNTAGIERESRSRYEHRGAYGPEGQWSCCANSNHNSRGCSLIYQQSKRWIYDSP